MKFLNLFKFKKKDHSFKIKIGCNDNEKVLLLQPKKVQDKVTFNCPFCYNEFRISTIDFYSCENDTIIINDHAIQQQCYLQDFKWSN